MTFNFMLSEKSIAFIPRNYPKMTFEISKCNTHNLNYLGFGKIIEVGV